MSDLLRQYEPHELGKDGYPYAWHGVDVEKRRTPAGGWTREQLAAWGVAWPPPKGWRSMLETPIKDLIREQAQNRCERCWHPYEKGMGEWSPCDEMCQHMGPLRWVYDDGPVSGEITEPLTILSTLGGTREDRLQAFRECAFHPEARWRILTVHHLDEVKANCRWWNLVALCQRCHLRMQRKVVMDRPWHYEHSTWFQPYAAGFYAFKYLNEDLDRTETMARLDELLSLERRFTQEVLL